MLAIASTPMTDTNTRAERVIEITLKDGSVANLRPLTVDDRDLLREGLRHMSEESRRLRFGVGVDNLSDAEILYLTDVDQMNHVAWGALIDGKPAGIGRYIRLAEPACAEIAVTVVDEFQRRGLARALVGALAASARANDVEDLCFAVDPKNEGVLRVLQGVETHYDNVDGMIEGRISIRDLVPTNLDDDLVQLLGEFQG